MRVEHWWFAARLRFRSVFRRRDVERELSEELQFHLEQKIEQGVNEGLSEKEARYAALRAMEGLEQRKEEMRDTRRVRWLTDFLDDARYGIRSLRRTPGVATFVVVALGLGIGLAASTFSILDALIFRPYPVPHPDEVVSMVSTTRENNWDFFSYREYLDIREKTKSYDGVIANAAMEAVGFSARPGETVRVKGGIMVSGNYFRVLGVEPRLGRGFREDEDRVAGRDAVVVLGPEFWKHEFRSDPSVVGKSIRLNGKPFTIVGVAPESFYGMLTFARPDFYVPLAMAPAFSTNPQKNFFEDREDRELRIKARLKRGVLLEQARGELALLARDFEREYPKANRNRGAALYTQFQTRVQEDQNWKFGVIFVVLGLAVLLVACTNAAALLLSRGRARTREIAVRLAIGAGRFRLVRLLLTESLVIAAVGGVCGVVLGYGIVQWFQTKQD
ncbi:MAG: ABC transporter permease, partial [Acidobacteriaceae bacterium]|nr:ABC transporter permease [Acidobacteriaceae bacterium]